MINRTLLGFAISLLTLFCLKAQDIKGVDYENRTISYVLEAEPPTLDTMDQVTSTSAMLTGHTFEGLMQYDENNKLVAGVAKEWQVSDDGLHYTFHLRKDAKWSDGSQVTAHDFEFAWKEVLNPKKASKYAFIMLVLKNAEEANAGKVPVDEIGVKAIDDLTLKVELKQPCGYFLSLTTFVTYMPAKQSFYEKVGRDKYAAEADLLLYNGPFVMTEWKHNSSIKLEKNTHYWNKDKIWLEHIDFNFVVKDKKLFFNLFNDGKVCLAPLDSTTVKSAMKEHFPIKKTNSGALFYLEFNHREGRLTSNLNLRKAIQYSFNAYEYVYKVVGIPGNLPGHSTFPMWLNGVNDKFRKEHPLTPITPNLKTAHEYLAKAKKDLGVDKIPAITLLISDSENARRDAEYIQEKLRKTLGLEIKLDIQTFKQRLAKSSKGSFDIHQSGWGPDYNDPMTFGDLFTSWNANNRGQFKNKDYDQEIRKAEQSTDQKVRMAAFARCQEIMQNQVAILPMLEQGGVYIQNPRLIGVIRNVIGADPSFVYAKITKEELDK